MKVVLFLLVAVCAAAAERSDAECRAFYDGRSLMSSILDVLGYNDTCIAAALDCCTSPQDMEDCSPPQHHAHFLALQEARGVVRQDSVTRGVVRQDSAASRESHTLPRHCQDLLDFGDCGSGLRQVYPYPWRPQDNITVFCDHTIGGGGWTVFQRRDKAAVRQNFNRTWEDYVAGFGDIEGEFWLGLDNLNVMTSSTRQQLRIDLDDYDKEHRRAKYDFFHVGAPVTNYRLTIGRYTGDAGDSLKYHNGSEFSTPDADHDTWGDNCALKRRGAWWYKACCHSNLNGYQHEGLFTPTVHTREGIVWHHWRGDRYSLRRTTMMFRPAI